MNIALILDAFDGARGSTKWDTHAVCSAEIQYSSRMCLQISFVTVVHDDCTGYTVNLEVGTLGK